MKTSGGSNISYLLTGLIVGAVSGIAAALLARKENRQYLRERGHRGLDYLDRQSTKLRESTAAFVEKGKGFLSRRCGSAEIGAGNGRQAAHEEKSEA